MEETKVQVRESRVEQGAKQAAKTAAGENREHRRQPGAYT